MKYADNPEIAKKYNSARWQKLRKLKKQQVGGLCERCKDKGILKPAYIVHHKDYVTEDNYKQDEIFFNLDNLEALCFSCHNEEHFKGEEDYFFDNEGNVRKKE